MRVLALLAAVVFGLAPAQAQQYPDRVIKLVVPFVPGSPVDVLGRVVSQQMSRSRRSPRWPAGHM